MAAAEAGLDGGGRTMGGGKFPGKCIGTAAFPEAEGGRRIPYRLPLLLSMSGTGGSLCKSKGSEGGSPAGGL